MTPPNDRPRVTVGLAVYNGERFLEAALRSIERQSFRDYEVVAIDDGSSDGTLAILQAHRSNRFHVLSQPNSGVALTRNRILIEARGEFIAYFDADDISLPERLEKQVRFLDSHPEVGVVGGQEREIGEEGEPLSASIRYPLDHVDILKGMGQRTTLNQPTAMFRKGVLDRINGFDARFAAMGEDEELFLRLSQVCAMANLPDFLIDRRIHRHSLCTRFPELPRKTRLALKGRGAISQPNATMAPQRGERFLQHHYLRRKAKALARSRRWRESFSTYLASLRLNPWNTDIYLEIAKLFTDAVASTFSKEG